VLAFVSTRTENLEDLIAEAILQKVDTLVSVSGIHANSTRQVAAVAANFRIKCTPLQLHCAPSDEGEFYRKYLVVAANGHINHVWETDLEYGIFYIQISMSRSAMKNEGNYLDHHLNETDNQ